MANKYCNLDGTKKIKDEYKKINIGFDKVETDVNNLDTKIDNVDNRLDTKIDNVDSRVNTIITTPADSVSAQEIIDARKGKPTLGTKIDEMDNELAAHKAESAKKTSGYISLKEYCVGDGITDDTTGFLNAVAFAKANKKALYVDGTFLIKQGIVIEDNTIPYIYGSNRVRSVLLFDIDSGYAIEAKTYFNRPLFLENITVRLKDVTKVAGGLKVSFGSGTWGGSVIAKNVTLIDFTSVVLNMVESFNSRFENCIFHGGVPGNEKVATLLKIEKTNNFSNVNNFDNCVFLYGKIGIQNLGGVVYTFNSCVFEFLSLFMHSPNLSGLSLRVNFVACWFERIDKGILNADIDENTLTPVLPVTNRANINFFKFFNNYVSAIPSNILDPAIEPDRYEQFTLSNGIDLRVRKQMPWIVAPLLNGVTGEIKYAKNSLGFVTVVIDVTLGSTVTTHTLLAKLPIGYRPFKLIAVTAVNPPDAIVDKQLYIATNGDIGIPPYQNYTASTRITTQVSFYVGD